ncbi:MAG: hypothetical protein F6K24_24610 [Okeania sp. SIO2D1]|nr:hypothetical protein [Okeania sp. SIO2D1]
MGSVGDGEIGGWGDGEMGRWGDGECGRNKKIYILTITMQNYQNFIWDKLSDHVRLYRLCKPKHEYMRKFKFFLARDFSLLPFSFFPLPSSFFLTLAIQYRCYRT